MSGRLAATTSVAVPRRERCLSPDSARASPTSVWVRLSIGRARRRAGRVAREAQRFRLGAALVLPEAFLPGALLTGFFPAALGLALPPSALAPLTVTRSATGADSPASPFWS